MPLPAVLAAAGRILGAEALGAEGALGGLGRLAGAEGGAGAADAAQAARASRPAGGSATMRNNPVLDEIFGVTSHPPTTSAADVAGPPTPAGGGETGHGGPIPVLVTNWPATLAQIANNTNTCANLLKILPNLGGGKGATGPVAAAPKSLGAFEAINAVPNQINAAKSKISAMMQNYTAALVAPASLILDAKAQVTTAFNTYLAAFTAPATMLKEMGGAVSGFVGLANPAKVQRFGIAIDNTFSEIGRRLEPILDALTGYAVKVGDTFAKLAPAIDPAIKAVSDLIDVSGEHFAGMMQELAPVIRTVADSMGTFVQVLRPVSEMIRGATREFVRLGQFLGIISKNRAFDANAKGGTAVRNVEVRSTEDIQRSIAQNALQASLGGKRPKEEEAQDSLITTIPNWLKQIKEALEGLPKAIAESILSGPKAAVGAVDSALGDPLASVAQGRKLGNQDYIDRDPELKAIDRIDRTLDRVGNFFTSLVGQ